MDPSRNGSIEAKASWNEPGSGLLDIRTAVPAPTTGTTATPQAYRVVTSSTSSSSTGPGSVSIAGTIRSGDTSILALTNNGTGPLAVPVVEATWP